MFELIVLTGEVVAEAALEDSAPVIPHAALALYALRVTTGACASMALQAFPPVAHPGLTKHGQNGGYTAVIHRTLKRIESCFSTSYLETPKVPESRH
jgi:hypothetical protein